MSNTNNYRFLRISYNKDELYQMALNSSSIEWQHISDGYSVGKLLDNTLVEDVLNQLPEKVTESCSVNFAVIRYGFTPHIDRVRLSAINFPLNVNASFFVAKEYPSKWFKENTIRQNTDGENSALNQVEKTNLSNGYKSWYSSVKFPSVAGNEEYYHIKDSWTYPYLLNVSIPHGVFQENNKVDRYIMTISSPLDVNTIAELCNDIAINNSEST